jgi:HK97 family phage portal protein
MGLLDTIKGLRRKSVDISALIEGYTGLISGTDPGYTSLSYGSMAREGYALNATVRNCVDTINNGLCSLPVYLMQTRATPAGQKAAHTGRHPAWLSKSQATTVEQPEDHPLNRLLKNPNPRQNRREFLEYLGGSLLLDGNAFIVPVNPQTRTGPPIGLYPLRPDMVQVEELSINGVIRYRYTYQPSTDGQLLADPKPFWDNEIVHIKLFNPTNGLRGLGPITAARASMDRANASEKWNYSLLKNSARTTGYLKPPASATENQKDQIKKIRDGFVGMLNAGQVPVLPGLDWQQISLSPLDMDWLQGDKNADEKIARAFRVPNQIVGIPGSQTFANYQEANRSLYENNIIPFGERILERLTSALAPSYGEGLGLVVDMDAVPALRENQDSLYARMNTAWWLTVNQKLQATGWETIGARGDVMMVPMGLIPLELAMAQDATTGDDVDDDAAEAVGGERSNGRGPFDGEL